MFDDNGELRQDLSLADRKIAENLRTSAVEEQENNRLFEQYQNMLEQQKEMARLEEQANQSLINKYLLQYQAQQGIQGSGVAQGLQLQQRDMSNNRLANIGNQYNTQSMDLFNRYVDINNNLDKKHTESELQFQEQKELENAQNQNILLGLLNDEIDGMLADGKTQNEIYNYLSEYQDKLQGNMTFDFLLDKYKPEEKQTTPTLQPDATTGIAKVEVKDKSGGKTSVSVEATNTANVNDLNKYFGSDTGGKQDKYYNEVKEALNSGNLEGEIITFNLGAQSKQEFYYVKDGKLYPVQPTFNPELVKIWTPDGYEQVGGTIRQK